MVPTPPPASKHLSGEAIKMEYAVSECSCTKLHDLSAHSLQHRDDERPHGTAFETPQFMSDTARFLLVIRDWRISFTGLRSMMEDNLVGRFPALTRLQPLNGREIMLLPYSIESVTGQDIIVSDLGKECFKNGQWVEISDDVTELAGVPGQLVQIQNIDQASRKITVNPAPATAVLYDGTFIPSSGAGILANQAQRSLQPPRDGLNSMPMREFRSGSRRDPTAQETTGWFRRVPSQESWSGRLLRFQTLTPAPTAYRNRASLLHAGGNTVLQGRMDVRQGLQECVLAAGV